MPVSAITALSAYMLINSFTPGPGNILTFTTMTTYGWKKGKPLFFGIICGYYCVQAICASAIFGLYHYLSPVLTVLKYLGGVYLLWLAVHIAKSKIQKTYKKHHKLINIILAVFLIYCALTMVF